MASNSREEERGDGGNWKVMKATADSAGGTESGGGGGGGGGTGGKVRKAGRI